MTTVLIHILPGHGPVGVWRHTGSELVAFYAPGHHQARDRATKALHARGDIVPWPAWFERLAQRSPYIDDYETIKADPGQPLDQLLADLT